MIDDCEVCTPPPLAFAVMVMVYDPLVSSVGSKIASGVGSVLVPDASWTGCPPAAWYVTVQELIVCPAGGVMPAGIGGGLLTTGPAGGGGGGIGCGGDARAPPPEGPATRPPVGNIPRPTTQHNPRM